MDGPAATASLVQIIAEEANADTVHGRVFVFDACFLSGCSRGAREEPTCSREPVARVP